MESKLEALQILFPEIKEEILNLERFALDLGFAQGSVYSEHFKCKIIPLEYQVEKLKKELEEKEKRIKELEEPKDWEKKFWELNADYSQLTDKLLTIRDRFHGMKDGIYPDLGSVCPQYIQAFRDIWLMLNSGPGKPWPEPPASLQEITDHTTHKGNEQAFKLASGLEEA